MLACLPLLLLAPGSLAPPQIPRQDVLILIADDVGYDDVHEIPTPNIARLAAQGMEFDRAYANPVCHLTRRSLHFGRFWIDTRGAVCDPADEFTPGALPSLPGLFQTLGYHTALFGKWHVGANPAGPWQLAPEFHGYDVWRAGLPTNTADTHCGHFGGYFNWVRVDDGVVTQSHDYIDTSIRDEFLSWWNSTRGPRFAVVSFQLAHEPFHQPPAELLPPGTPPPANFRERFEHMVEALDTLVGQVVSVAGPEDLVLFLGDNGTPQDVAPEPRRAKTTTFERGIHVPFIVRAPFVKPGQHTESLVHVVDVLPTLSVLQGQKPPPCDGISFVPVLLDPQRHTRSYILSGLVDPPRGGHTMGGEPPYDICLRSDRYKLRIDRDQNELFYDLLLDPGENAPVSLTDPAYAAVLRWHRKTLAGLLRSL